MTPASGKRYRRGFLLGKFLPPHEGHLHLVRSGLALCDELTVLVCTLPDDSLPGERRAAWMRELCVGARVVHVTEEVPSHPDDDRRSGRSGSTCSSATAAPWTPYSVRSRTATRSPAGSASRT